MKKFFYISLAVALFGAVISSLLLFLHFNPDAGAARFFCGHGTKNTCMELRISGWSEAPGFPVAAAGLFFYMFMLITTLVADFAKAQYYNYSLLVLLPASMLALAASVILSVILVITGMYCPLCFLLHAMNLVLFVCMILWHRHMRKEGTGIRDIAVEAIASVKTDPNVKAVFSSFVIITLFIAIASFSVSSVLESRAPHNLVSYKTIKNFIAEYNKAPREDLRLGESALVTGNPDADITITVFTDFLCTYCHLFYGIEEHLLEKYKQDTLCSLQFPPGQLM